MPPATSRSDQCVGNKGGVSGILYKWVNYGKGWRRRWFDLEDGVLSYYKIHHGPHHHHHHQQKIIIGQNSLRRISPHNNATSQLPSNPVGQLHLKVSSIRESRSDDKRFSVFTGTNKLHLRAETREDRVAWTDTLQAAKDMFPRVSNSELLAPVDDFVVSTEKLRQRLLKECVSEATIRDSEQIMKNEFTALRNQLVLLKQKNWQLLDTLQQLEVHVMISRKKHANSIQNSSAQNPVHPSASETTQINCPTIGCF